MAVATKEAVMTLPLAEEKPLETPTAQPQAKTFKTQSLDETKDYHFVMRTVNIPAGPGTISPTQLDDDISMWLSQGYTIHSIHPLGPYMPEGAGRVFGYTFGYHLVRG